jgi:predicted transcriptional regulator
LKTFFTKFSVSKTLFINIYTIFQWCKGLNNRREQIEEVIIQGLSHQERRSILKIISLAEDGASYSAILGELGLNTGRMNYHLRQLGGLVVRNGERRYHLTPLGKKALSVLHSMTEDLENGYEEYLNSARTARSSGVATWVNRWFYLTEFFTITAMLGLVVFLYQSVTAGILPYDSYYYLAGFAMLVVVLIVWLRHWTEKEAERVQDWWDSIMDRLMGRNR